MSFYYTESFQTYTYLTFLLLVPQRKLKLLNPKSLQGITFVNEHI